MELFNYLVKFALGMFEFSWRRHTSYHSGRFLTYGFLKLLQIDFFEFFKVLFQLFYYLYCVCCYVKIAMY